MKEIIYKERSVIMKVEITRLNHNGEGVGQINGKIIFVPKTLPGDIVEATTVEDHKNFIRGVPTKFYQKSNVRIPSNCPYFNECGGCQFLELPYQEQLKYKKEKVINILKKYANLDVNPTIKESKQYHYRNKITLQVQNGKIGLFSTKTNNLVSIKSCLLISDAMNQLIELIQSEINLQEITGIIIKEAQSNIMVQLIGKTNKQNLIKILSPEVTSLYLNEKCLFGTKYIKEKLGDYEFQVSPASFFQVNHEQTINLYNQVKIYLGPNNNHVLDLYCGTGSIGIYVSDCCKKITGIELNSSAVKDANQNVLKNNLSHVKVYEGDVGKILKTKNTYDAIIVDPPRSGLDKRTKQVLKQIKCPKIIYVSCNPITLARDLNDLKEIYDLKDISLFDMFPNTYHVESVVLLELKDSGNP